MSRIIFLFFFLSGLSALIFEVAWVRELGLTLGNTAHATSTVLGVYLGGLALGAYLGGKFADRWGKDALEIYGALEILVGGVALIVSLALHNSNQIYLWLYQVLSANDSQMFAVRLIVSALLLLLPTMLMGATLPILVRYLAQFKQSARMFSLLYGVNTLGAAGGSAIACFAGFPYVGIKATLFCAAALNILIGTFAILLSRRQAHAAETAEQTIKLDTKPEPDLQIAADQSTFPLTTLCIISFLSGFTALSYEVLWTRIFRCYLTSLTYSFTVMICMFLLGLAIGSLIHEYWVTRSSSKGNSYLRFGICQYFAAFGAAMSLPLLSLLIFASPTLRQFMFAAQLSLFNNVMSQIYFTSIVTGVSILLPAILIGMIFPMLGTLAAKSDNRPALAVGIVYAANTVGCVFGSLVCGFILVPAIGSVSTFQWIVLLTTATGALALVFDRSLGTVRRLALCIVPILLSSTYFTLHFDRPLPEGAILLRQAEDASGSMRVYDMPNLDGIRLEINGSSLSSTVPAARRYMRLLAHLPILLHPNPQNVLVACFGTGTTCGAASIHPEVKRLDLVEISKIILDAAPSFHNTNFDVLNNPKVVVHLNDVRNYLLTANRKFDVVTFEPPPPLDAGIVNLYTEEFYRLVADHLTHDGIVCQWVPMHAESKELWRMMVATARSVFPYVSVFLPNSKEAMFVASMEPIKMNFADIQRRIDASPQVKASMHEVGFDGAMGLLSTFVASGRPLDNFLKDSLPVTDDLPRLEFFMPYEGELLKEPELEAVGADELNGMYQTNKNVPGFNSSEFLNNWMAIHWLRQIDNSHWRPDVDKDIDEAKKVLPDNKWVQFVDSHRGQFYPRYRAVRVP